MGETLVGGARPRFSERFAVEQCEDQADDE